MHPIYKRSLLMPALAHYLDDARYFPTKTRGIGISLYVFMQ